MDKSDFQSLSEFYSVTTEVTLLLAKNQLGDIDKTVTEALGILGRFAKVDRVYVFTFNYEEGQSYYDYEWCEEGTEPQIHLVPTVSMEDLSDWIDSFTQGKHVYLPSIPDMEDTPLKEILVEQSIKSLIVYPMFHGDDLLGFVGFDSVSGFRNWEERDFSLLKIACDSIGSSLSGAKYRRELLKAKDAAEKANAYKSEFLANMSHELRSPLNSVIGFSELIEFELGNADDERIREYAGLIRSGGKHLLSLINDILDLARIETGKMQLDKRIMDMRELLELAAGTFKLAIENRKQSLSLSLGETPLYLEADETRLRQVVHNLLSNASKFTGPGKKIGLEMWSEGERVGFTIWDEGRGIPDDWKRRVFEPFEQVNTADAELEAGAGLGLAIVNRIVTMHDGSIRLESEMGKGTRFRISLPRGEVAGALPDQKTVRKRALVSVDGLCKRVLYVDDIDANRRLLSYGLSMCNYSVDTVENGERALERLERESYDIVLLDIKLPGISGFDVYSKLRAKGYKMPVLAVTASLTKEIVDLATELGFDGFHGKPVNFDKLLESMQKCLNGSA